MSLTLTELKTEVDETFSTLTIRDWKDKSDFRGITKRSQKDFDNLLPMYVRKIGEIRERLRGDWSVTLTPIVNNKLKTPQEMGDELVEQLQYFLDKETRLIDKFAACLKEVQMRKDGDVIRTGLHDAANYYVDYANGTDGGGGTVHDGLAEPADPGGAVYTMIDATSTSTDGTHAVLAINDFDNDTDDNYNGDFLYNITRSTGVIITDYDADDDDDGSVLTHPNIAGQVAGDTFYILRAVKKMNYITSTLVRTVGDVIFLRANTTWLQGTDAEDILTDESGDIDEWIKVIGCDSVTNDPWVDGDDTLPIIDFEDAAYQLSTSLDEWWWFERIVFTQSADTSGAVNVFTCLGRMHFETCTFSEGATAIVEGLIINTAYAELVDCTFTNCHGTALSLLSVKVFMDNCTFNGGAGTNFFAITCTNGDIWIKDSSFGDGTAFGAAVFDVGPGGLVYTRNISYTGTLSVATALDFGDGGGSLFTEDLDETFESHVTYDKAGTITRDTGTVRGGGADSSAKMEPNANCGVLSPLVLGDPLRGFAKVWLAAGSYTVSVYARVGSAWDSALTAAECYIKTSELDNAGNATRVERQSSQQILNDTNWQAFTTSISPAREGFVYIWLYLEEFEDATEHIFVDIKPVVA